MAGKRKSGVSPTGDEATNRESYVAVVEPSLNLPTNALGVGGEPSQSLLGSIADAESARNHERGMFYSGSSKYSYVFDSASSKFVHARIDYSRGIRDVTLKSVCATTSQKKTTFEVSLLILMDFNVIKKDAV